MDAGSPAAAAAVIGDVGVNTCSQAHAALSGEVVQDELYVAACGRHALEELAELEAFAESAQADATREQGPACISDVSGTHHTPVACDGTSHAIIDGDVGAVDGGTEAFGEDEDECELGFDMGLPAYE